ncbi:hypothetical protein JYU34_019928 [Plutella xylostella]|uniref:FP protein C-terminal domain-containing protein n=1 Tax=Plutella xylostella TaxID=51655 RepID=A0ABQ7PWY2_PLUXY|nr:hypothetical protein JYU34_019928 [Plutella xylostella]
MDCQNCKKPLSKRGPHFKCGGICQGTFHKACVKGLAAEIKAGIVRTHCNNCDDAADFEQEDKMEDAEQFSSSNNNVLKDINRKIGMIKDVKIQLISLTQSIDFLSEKYELLLTEHTKTKSDVVRLDKNITQLTNKCTYLEKCNGALEEKIMDIEQKTRRHNLQIVGVECMPDEKVSELVKKLGDLIGATTNHISSVNRMPERSKNKTASILVRFNNDELGYAAREDWMSRRHAVSLDSSAVTGGSATHRIYVNEDLTRDIRNLLWKAKTELKGIYQYVWVRHGRVQAKKDAEGRPIWIRSESDISELKG